MAIIIILFFPLTTFCNSNEFKLLLKFHIFGWYHFLISSICQPIYINFASKIDLQKLKGVGPTVADNNKAYLGASGNFWGARRPDSGKEPETQQRGN